MKRWENRTRGDSPQSPVDSLKNGQPDRHFAGNGECAAQPISTSGVSEARPSLSVSPETGPSRSKQINFMRRL